MSRYMYFFVVKIWSSRLGSTMREVFEKIRTPEYFRGSVGVRDDLFF